MNRTFTRRAGRACLSLMLALWPFSIMSAETALLPAPVETRVGPLLDNPLGYGERQPQFSWKLPPAAGMRQSAWEIACARTPDALEREPDLWRSGWVASSQSTFADYAGLPLQSRDLVFWKVRYQSGDGHVSAWSRPAHFEMALLEAADWQADWIYLPGSDPEGRNPAPFLRREFVVADKPVARARVYAASRGIHELQLNGQRVGDALFQSEWTDYAKRQLFQTHDVTGQIRPGKNAVGAALGESWYAGRLGWQAKRNIYGERPELLLQLEISYADGSRQVVVSDAGWQGRSGPIVYSNIYDGERYDARLELDGWSMPGHAAAGWLPVGTSPRGDAVLLQARPHQPVRIIRELRPVSLTRIEPGRYIFDLGQNLVGWARITVPGKAGHTYTLRFAEMLQDDGQLYTDNYRSAESTDTYTCRSDAPVAWEPRFTFHGFRYLELSPVPDGLEPDLGWVTGVVLHNDMPETGSFSSSHAMLNRLQSNIQWGQRGNFLAVPTDCPQRDERLGWTGDAQVFCATANYNFDTLAFFVKWCADMRDSQRPDGSIPYYVPDFPDGKGVSSAWGDAAVIVPWEVYQSFGYKRILEDNYAMMAGWVRHYQEHPETRGLIYRGFTFGDWLQPYTSHPSGTFGETDSGLIGTAYFARSAGLLARAATVLGRDEDAARYRRLFEDVRTAFQAAFFDETGRLTTEFETQTGYLLALGFDLLDAGLRPRVLGLLKAHIADVAGGHLRTGFLGTPLINPVLTASGELPLAYDILFRTSYPGWFYSIQQGATTMWERWNSYSREDGFGSAGMNSFNHYAYGAIGEWLYETVAGLQAAEPGYSAIRFHPHPGGPLTRAEARLETVHGLATSAWELRGDVLHYTCTVPPNTRGELVQADGSRLELGPGTHAFQRPTGGDFTPAAGQP